MKYLLCCTFTFINKVLILFQEFSLDLVISQQWTDPRLNNSLDHPIVLPGDSKNLIWLPDTFFLNIRSASIHDVMSENSKLSIKPGGVVSYSTRLTITAGCSMDLSDYPLDEQKCDLKISSFAYDTDELVYKWSSGKIRVEDSQLSQLALIQTDALKDAENYPDGLHSQMVARFWFKRRLGYAFIQIYFPTIMLVVLSWLVFWIPQDSVPARVSLGSTTMLSIVTFTGSFRKTLPKVSYIKAVDVYFIVSFAFIFAALMEYILLLLDSGIKRKRSSYSPEQSPDGCRDDSKTGKQVDDAQELQEVKVENPVSGKENTQSSLMVSVKTAKEYVQYAFVNNEASNIDRVCRFLFPSCYLIFNIIYWCYYELSSSFGKRPDE